MCRIYWFPNPSFLALESCYGVCARARNILPLRYRLVTFYWNNVKITFIHENKKKLRILEGTETKYEEEGSFRINAIRVLWLTAIARSANVIIDALAFRSTAYGPLNSTARRRAALPRWSSISRPLIDNLRITRAEKAQCIVRRTQRSGKFGGLINSIYSLIYTTSERSVECRDFNYSLLNCEPDFKEARPKLDVSVRNFSLVNFTAYSDPVVQLSRWSFTAKHVTSPKADRDTFVRPPFVPSKGLQKIVVLFIQIRALSDCDRHVYVRGDKGSRLWQRAVSRTKRWKTSPNSAWQCHFHVW